MKKTNILLASILLMVQPTVFAYIGPGAGIPFIGSFIGFIITVVLVISAILFWPIRKILKRNKANKANKVNKAHKANKQNTDASPNK